MKTETLVRECVNHHAHKGLLDKHASLFHPKLENGRETTVELKRIIALWAPLGLVQLFQRTCRPIINLVVARDRLHGMTSEEAVKVSNFNA